MSQIVEDSAHLFTIQNRLGASDSISSIIFAPSLCIAYITGSSSELCIIKPPLLMVEGGITTAPLLGYLLHR